MKLFYVVSWNYTITTTYYVSPMRSKIASFQDFFMHISGILLGNLEYFRWVLSRNSTNSCCFKRVVDCLDYSSSPFWESTRSLCLSYWSFYGNSVRNFTRNWNSLKEFILSFALSLLLDCCSGVFFQNNGNSTKSFSRILLGIPFKDSGVSCSDCVTKSAGLNIEILLTFLLGFHSRVPSEMLT